MDNKIINRVRAFAQKAIPRTLLCMFILIFSMSSSVFASDLTMTTEMAQGIIDYYKENINLFYNESLQTEANINRAKGYLNNLDPSTFANSVNSNFLNVIKNNSKLSQTTFENITALGIVESECLNLYFIVSNCSYPKDMNLDYMYFKKLSVNNRFQISNFKGENDYGVYKTNVKISSNMVWSQYPGFTTYESSIYQPYVINLPTFNEDKSIMYLSGVLSLAGVQEIYSNFNTNDGYYIIGDTINGKLPIVPDTSESGDIGSGDNESGDAGGGTTTPSGDTGGTTTPDYTEQLGNIQTGITNIENKIPSSGDVQNIVSGEVNKVVDTITKPADFENKEISSGDILGAINYEPPDDPYANFWFELTEILNNAFTGNLRELTIQGPSGKSYLISIDNIKWNPSTGMRTFLTLASTSAVGIAIIKWIKIMVDKISAGSMDEVLEANEEGICNLF